ncbi:fractalkine isoform X1 [Marmota marmota marmota]|uniref:fractalkine isoform X1 n=1 Tax=Marmota marmota marmota TaxID=9994 RepID=UPI00076293F0|nr:fractalkine isoform X1 [Marmota marmota marmota]
MAPTPLAWLLSLATLCHLTILVAETSAPGSERPPPGQHHGVTKCNITCSTMTRPIPVNLLIGYWKNPESCGRRAVVLETKRHKYFCADPKEKWVQEAMKHLNRSAHTQNGGTFEKQIGSEPTITPATTEGQSHPAFSEPEATGEGNSLEVTTSSQEAQRSMGTSPQLPVGTTDSSGYRSTPTSKAPEERPPAGPRSTEPVETAVASTTVAQQSQTGPGLRVIKAHSETHSTQVLSMEPPSTQTPDMSYPALEETTLSKGQPTSGRGQTPSPETSPGPEEMSPVSTPGGASQDSGPGKMTHAPVVPVSSEGTPSQEPVASGSWAPKTNTQRLTNTSGPINTDPGPQEATRRQAVGLLAFLGLLFCLGVAMFAYQSLQGCPRKMAGEMVEGLRYVPRSCGSNSYVLVPV